MATKVWITPWSLAEVEDETNSFFVALLVGKKIRLSTGPATSRLVIKYEGVSTYEGQTIEFYKGGGTHVPNSCASKDNAIKHLSEGTLKSQPRKLTKITDNLAKKRKKKLTWKQKQALQKKMRPEEHNTKKSDTKEFIENQKSQIQKTQNSLSTQKDKTAKKRKKKLYLALKRKQELKR